MGKKKILPLMLAAIFLMTTILAGCSGSTTSDPKPTSPKGSTESGKAPNSNTGGEKWEFGSSELAFSAYTHYGWQDFPQKMEDVPFWKYLKDNKKVNITSIIANGAHNETMAKMMANNDLPDLIYGDRNHPDILRLYKAGKLVALDDYMDKYPNLKKALNSKAADLLRAPDGKLYQFPNYYTDRPNGSSAYVVNKKIYKELGSPPLETMDQLYDYLVKVKQKYGNDIIPFDPDRVTDIQGLGVLYTGFKENAYLRSLNNNLLAVTDEQNNKLASIFTDPALRESQKFASKLYREKLMNQDMFAPDRGLVEERVLNGRVAVYAGTSPLVFANRANADLTKKDPDAGYFVIWPIHKAGLDKNKIYTNGWDQLGWNVSVITTDAKEPEKIFAFLDWLTGPEGMSTMYFGPEGESWKGFDENQHPIFTDKHDPAKASVLESENDKVIMAANAGYVDPVKEKFELSKPVDQQSWMLRYQSSITWKTHIDHTALATNLVPEPGTTEAEISVNVIEVFTQALAASATATSDEEVDKILDQAEKDAVALGYNDLLEWRTQQWLKNKEILGLK